MLDTAVEGDLADRQMMPRHGRAARLRTDALRWREFILLLVVVPLLVWRIDVWPAPWFDEGYSMHPARALTELGLYGTYSVDGPRPWDTGVTTGPAVIVPIAASFALFGPGVIQARLVVAVYACLALVCLYLIARFIFGPGPAFVSALVLLALPALYGVSFLLMGRQVLGEMPALALISLGLLLWFRIWERGRSWHGLLAGVICGIGLTCKMQIAIGVVPAVLLIGGLRALSGRGARWANLGMPLAAVAVAGAWLLVMRTAAPPELAADYARTLNDSMRTHLFVPLSVALPDNLLAPLPLALFATCALAAYRLWRARAPGTALTDRGWAEAALALIILASTVWQVAFSIGWPRYLFVPLVLSIVLLGAYAAQGLRALALLARVGGDERAARLLVAASFILILGAFGQVAFSMRDDEPPGAAQRMGQIIRTTIPRAAVIESWEWEVDALSGHWNFHHPSHREAFEAIRQLFHERRDFDLSYDVLQADPDYLLLGPFSSYTDIYDPEAISRHFVRIAYDGPYTLFRRVS
jgi:4-amino-4-deoxy-L-arabinose transferase-like glycosyltransferase